VSSGCEEGEEGQAVSKARGEEALQLEGFLFCLARQLLVG